VLESLIEALGPRHVLLVLDNFEQVLDGAVMIPPVLAACLGARARHQPRGPSPRRRTAVRCTAASGAEP
jgi:hypothetical protein